MRRKEDTIFKESHLVEYQETIKYDEDAPSIFLYVLEVIESNLHRQEYIVHLGTHESRLIFDCTMGLPRWYLVDNELKYIRPIASYDEVGTRTQNPRLFSWK